MKIHLGTYRYAAPRRAGEGLRIGTARFAPRGVRRDQWQSGGYFDLWLPLLAPPADLVKAYRHGTMTFAAFSRHYHSAMKERSCEQVIDLLAGITLFLPMSVGCFCEDETKCHRSVLRSLIEKAAARKAAGFEALAGPTTRPASPVCFADLEDE